MNKDQSQTRSLLHLIIYGYLKRKRETAPEAASSWPSFMDLLQTSACQALLGPSGAGAIRKKQRKEKDWLNGQGFVQASEHAAAEVERSFPWRAIERQGKMLLWERGGFVRWFLKTGAKRKKKEQIVKSFAEYKSGQARPGQARGSRKSLPPPSPSPASHPSARQAWLQCRRGA